MKKLFFIMLVVLISVSLFAEKKVEKFPLLNDVNPVSVIPAITDEVGDIIFELDVESIVSDNQCLGVEYDGTYVWITGGGNAADPNKLYKIDPVAGTLIATYDQPAVATGWGIRDLAYVGSENKIYGGNETNFFSFDIATETWTTEFASTFGTIRALAYDGNHFWTKSFSDPIYEFDVTGTLINTYADANSAYGFAYDSFADCLWLFASPTTFVQFGLDGVPTGISYTVTLPNAGIIGGAFYYEGGLVPGKTILGCLGQGTPDTIYGMELRDAAPLDAPGAPTAVTVVPDAGGALEVDIDWICPSVQVNGDPLTDLDEMEVYRDNVLIYTDSSPTIGGAGSYSDIAVPSSGTYAYKVVGINSAGEGIPVVISTWVGEDVPNVVEDLLLEQSYPGVLSGTLTWVNPTTGLNGGAFNNAILGYHIERSDGIIFEVTGLETEYVDGTIPAAGIYYYAVQAYNSVGDGGVAESNSVLIADAGLLVMEDFSVSVPPAGWEVLGMNPGNWSQSATNNAGGTAPEVQFSWTPSFTGFSALTTMPLNTTGATTLSIEYMHFLNDYSGSGYTIGVKTTSDGGTTWNDAFSWAPTGDIGPELVVEEISTPDVGSATCQIGFFFDGYSFDLDYYYIDDVMVTMPPGDPGTIEGNVTLDGGTGDVEDVEVSAGGVIVNPDASGDYEITVPAGTYDVTATLDGYEEGIITDVIVTIGNATSGVDFTLISITVGDGIIIAATKLNGNYPNPFNPVTSIAYSIKDAGNVTIEVYNLKGQLVKTLVNEVKETGDHTAIWNGTDNSNKSVSSGVYFYKMVSVGSLSTYTSSKKMILMK